MRSHLIHQISIKGQICLQINEENEQFKEGKSSYYEKLNVHSDVPKDMFEKQFEGAKLPNNGRGMGAVLPSEDEWYTHPDLEALYNSRQTPPASYDATALGTNSYSFAKA